MHYVTIGNAIIIIMVWNKGTDRDLHNQVALQIYKYLPNFVGELKF